MTITDNDNVTIPNAPSNLVATSGTSTISLTWTDNSSDETNFRVYRSSDNSTWGSYYAQVGANVTSYTDNNPGNGTAWYYKVFSYNSAGESATGAQLPTNSYAATVVAYEGFNYADVNAFNGGTSGVGLGNWSLTSTTSIGITSGSLTYTDSGGGTLTTSGNRATFTLGKSASNTLNTTVGPTGGVTDLWIGFEYTCTVSSVQFEIGTPTTNEVKVCIQGGTIWMIATINSTTYGANTNFTPSSNVTYFIAAEIKYLNTGSNGIGDVESIYVSPKLGNPAGGITSPTGYLASATNTLPTNAMLTNTNAIIIGPAASGSNVTTFDELRFGVSYVSVAPDPLVEELGQQQAASLPAPADNGLALAFLADHANAIGSTVGMQLGASDVAAMPVGGQAVVPAVRSAAANRSAALVGRVCRRRPARCAQQ